MNCFPGDDSNRELVARKCGNEFDKYLACGSETDGEENDEDTGGGKIGIAASGDVVCCDNRCLIFDHCLDI